MTRNVGILGFGNVGRYVYSHLKEHGIAQVAFVFDLFIDRVSPRPFESVAQMDEAALREVFLVVETAEPHAVKTYGPDIVKRAHLLISSLSALADDSLFEELSTLARSSGTHLFVPHGAVLGLDGIRDGRHLIESIMVTTVKNPRNLAVEGLEGISGPTVLFEGPTREACKRFPRNVNVHASVAIAGLGFDKTVSKIVADPGVNTMSHEISVRGRGLQWRIEVQSSPVGAVTGMYTPESIYQSVARVCDGDKSVFQVV